MFLNLENLTCIVCLNILEDPHLISCPSNCIACKQCILNFFRMTAEEFNSRNLRIPEVQTGVRCLCNAEGVFVSLIKADIVTNRLVKNIIIRCPNHINGCSWFSNTDASEDILDQHTRNCR